MTSTVEDPIGSAPFAAEEFAARQNRVRERVIERGLDGIVVCDPANIYYLTGYNAWSFYMPQVLYLSASSSPVLLLREMDARGAHRTASSIRAADVLGYPETLVERDDVHPGTWMGEQLRDLGHGRAVRVGYEGDAHFLTVRTFRALAESLPEWKLEDCHGLVNWVRLVKSSAEIELMRAAGRVCGEAMRAGLAALRPGRPLNEVAAQVVAAQARGVGDTDGDYPAIAPLMPSGAGADTPHLTWSAAPVPVDEPISLELAGAHRRYHALLARTAVVGRPPAQLEHLAAVTIEAFDVALETVRPGVSASDVATAFIRVIESAGYSKASRLGYSIGVGYPPDWGERTVSLRSGDETVLAENMTFHLLAGMWITGSGFEVSESIRVTSDGIELLTDVPRELIVVDPTRPR